jgi:type 1 glutamine amidotransferase
MMKLRPGLAVVGVLGLLAMAAAQAQEGVPQTARPQPEPLRIFLRGGPKTHGPAANGQHDGPSFLREWQPLLQGRGAAVDGALRFPTANQLVQTDVLVMFAADAGRIVGEERAAFEAFLKRGGGVVCFHDAVVTPKEGGGDPRWFASIVGGAWEHGMAKYFEGDCTYYVVNGQHPMTRELSNFRINDEVYWDLHLMPEAHILVAAMQPERRRPPTTPAAAGTQPATAPIGKLIPQIWTYERALEGGKPYRAVVNLMGHHFSTLSEPHARPLFLRAIAWGGGRDGDLLTTAEERAAMK